MWHLSMNLFNMFDQTRPYYSKQNYGKTYSNEKQSQSLTLSPKVKVIAKGKDNNLGNKNMPPVKKLQGFP